MDGGINLPSGAYINVIKSHGVLESQKSEGEETTSLLFEKDECFYVRYSIFFCLFASILIVVSLKDIKAMKKVFHVIPESGCLVITGIIVSGILTIILKDSFKVYLPIPSLEILIIPIILHASYSLFHPHFFGQLGTILVFSFIATFLNVLFISGYIYLYKYIETDFNLYHSLTFASIIAAVDPVAVLAVFKEVHADRRLHYLIFGESLLNDGVTFVLFEGFHPLTPCQYQNVGAKTYVYISLSFLTAPLGGVVVGYVIGVISTLHYKWTNRHTSIMINAVLSYSFAHMFGFSGIISLITFGLTQERYTFENMNPRDQINANNIVHGFAVIFESILFLIIGFELTDRFEDLKKYITFCMIALLAVLLARAVVNFIIVNVLNCFRNHPIDFKWQAIIFLGGLRGAVAYAMVVSYKNSFKDMFVIATVFIIVVTTLLNGILTKPLVLFLGLKQGDHVNYQDYYKDEKRNVIFRAFYWFEQNCVLTFLYGKAKSADDISEESVGGEEEEEEAEQNDT